ncbi:MAG TPA: FAD-dependent oxidoreductase [Jatrophihabitantaceae bacterium]|nr:FAD-dependent oxidoreductase [Jatrophihabitantaceae bacterium]
MPDDASYELLLSPLQIRGVPLRNRVITTGHSIAAPWAFVRDDSDNYIEYSRRRAAGGVALLITQPVIVDPFTGWPSQVGDRLAKLADAVHAEGGRLISQVVNFGSQIGSQVNLAGRPMWSLNGRQDEFGEASHRMTGDEIGQIVDAHGQVARVLVEAGFDGLELHAGHGYLLHQSYSPWGNGRDDEWGETLALSRAIIDVCRRELGPNRILGWRFTANDDLRREEGGQSVDDLRDIVVQVAATGEIDILNPTIGTKAPAYSQKSVAGYRYPDGYDLPYSSAVRPLVDAKVAVVGVGGIVSPSMAEKALRDGACDLVGMTRGNISDPDMVNKLRAGQADRVRICVRAAECNDRRVDGKPVGCFHNPEMLREKDFSSSRAATSKRVVVIGAGPGGLKAAQSALARGHSVRVFEAAAEPGGRLRYVRATTARRLFQSVEWMLNELAVGGVKVEYETPVSIADLDTLDADEFVVATGARPVPAQAFETDDVGAVLSVEQAIDNNVSGSVLVLDRTGSIDVALVTEALIKREVDVVYATIFERTVTNAGYTNRLDLRDLFRRSKNVRVLTDTNVRRYAQGAAELIDPDGTVIEQLRVPTVVAGTHPLPADELLTALRASGRSVTGVGDVLAPRGAGAAFREGALFAQAF